MNAEQIEKAIELCQTLQAYTLDALVQSVKGGQRLGAKDLQVIQDIRKQLEAQRQFANGAEEWLPLHEASKRLGVNVRTLQLWCSGKDAQRQPPLPHRKDNRRVMLPLHAAHAHLTQHAKRLALKSIEPAGAAEQDVPDIADADMPADLVERLGVTLSRMSQRLMATPHGLRLYSQTLKCLEETKARREAALRNLTPESPLPATSLARISSKVSEMYLRKIRPRTTCLYSAESMLLRILSAASQSLASKPRLAVESAADLAIREEDPIKTSRRSIGT